MTSDASLPRATSFPTATRLVCLALGAAALLGAAACSSDPIDPDALSRRSADDVGGIFQAAAESVRGNPGAQTTVTRVGDGAGIASRGVQAVPVSPMRGQHAPPPVPAVRARSPWQRILEGIPAVRATKRPFFTEPLFGREPDVRSRAVAPGTGAGSELAADIEDAGENFRRLLRERILVPGNLESRNDEEAVYLLRPESTCRDLDDPLLLDQACADQLGRIEIRVRLTESGGGSRLDLLVGRQRVRPASIAISPVAIALDLFLGDVKRALALGADALGEPDGSPDVMQGTVRFALRKDGPRSATVALSVIADVLVSETGNAPGESVVFRTAAADPVLAVSADGGRGQILSTLGLGATDVELPWTPEGDAIPGAAMRVRLAGLRAEATFTDATEQVRLARVGLGPGPLIVDVRGRRILQVDLNERDGRAFDALIAFVTGEIPRVTVTPRFDLSMAWNLAAVAADYAQPPPAYLLDEAFRVLLDGTGAGAPALEPYEAPGLTGDDGLRIVSGRLTLASSKVATPVVAGAGQCLLSRTPAAGEHPVLGGFRVTNCP